MANMHMVEMTMKNSCSMVIPPHRKASAIALSRASILIVEFSSKNVNGEFLESTKTRLVSSTVSRNAPEQNSLIAVDF